MPCHGPVTIRRICFGIGVHGANPVHFARLATRRSPYRLQGTRGYSGSITDGSGRLEIWRTISALLHRLGPQASRSAFRYIRSVFIVAACSRTDYQLQLSQTPVKDMAWWQLGQTSPILPSFMFERASFGDSAWAAIQVLHARSECICSSVASSGVPRMVPLRHSKWLQSGSCRSLGPAPVRLPSRCTGYTTYLISGCSMMAATDYTLRSESRRSATL